MVILTPGERAAFKRCRRAWDLGAPGRRNLEPATVELAAVDLATVDRWLRDALAVYYFPGMWDWSRAVVLPLVTQGLDKALAQHREHLGGLRSAFDTEAKAVRGLLQAYIDWAPAVERLAPVLVEVDYEVSIPNPSQHDTGLMTPDGHGVRYRGRVDLLAVDEHDAYWIVRHRLVEAWTTTDQLIRDEEAAAACWAWQEFYIGMTIAGTVHNEFRMPSGEWAPGPPPAVGGRERGGVPQHEGSGGGRSIPQHRRLYAQASEPAEPERIVEDHGPWFRRTWIRRSPAEVDAAGRQLAIEARDLLDPSVPVYPNPSPSACAACPFAAPCGGLYEGRDVELALATDYRSRAPAEPVEGRLGGVTWSTGRGAAPPRFPRS